MTDVAPQYAMVKFAGYQAQLGPAEIKWTRYPSPQGFLTRGDIVYVKVDELNGAQSRVSLEQESGVQGALLALDNSSGDIKAMVGGRDFEQSKFNRATQAMRQVGSSFKPYIYTAAIDQGTDARRYGAGCADQLSQRLPAPTRRITTMASSKASLRFATRWRSRATFLR